MLRLLVSVSVSVQTEQKFRYFGFGLNSGFSRSLLTSVLLLLTHFLVLGLSFLSYTKLDLMCRNKYCCSKSINLRTKFAGYSCMKSSQGKLLHRSVRLERELIYQINWELGSQKGGRRNNGQGFCFDIFVEDCRENTCCLKNYNLRLKKTKRGDTQHLMLHKNYKK